jgi:hypothetical protein
MFALSKGSKSLFLTQFYFIVGLDDSSSATCNDVTIVTRKEWNARPSKEINYMGTPVSVVFIHHTYMNECDTPQQCEAEVRNIQNFHKDDRGNLPILYTVEHYLF